VFSRFRWGVAAGRSPIGSAMVDPPGSAINILKAFAQPAMFDIIASIR
jgi:hypothetical protein